MSVSKIIGVYKIEDVILDSVYFILRICLRPIIKFIWIKNVVGIRNIPQKGAAILAMNHQSYFDFLCLVAISPRNIHFLAAEKFFDHWIWKHLMWLTRQVKVNRFAHDKSEVHKLIHEHIDNKKLIGLFPEGTRSPHEHEMLKAFVGVAKYSLMKRIPVIPVGIRGTFKVMSKHDKKPKLIKNVEIYIGRPIHFTEHYNNVSHLDHKIITHKIMQEISILSNKKYPHEL